MPVKKGLKPYARKTEATADVRPRLAVIEAVMMRVTPVWNPQKKKFVAGATLAEACAEEGITAVTFRSWRNEDKRIGDYVNNLRNARKEMLHSMMEQAALDNVMEGINGGVKLRPMDKINVSLRYLEKTSAEFNPAIKLDVEDKTNPLLSMNRQEMEQRILELSNKLNVKINYDDTRTIQLSSPATTTDIEESAGDGEI